MIETIKTSNRKEITFNLALEEIDEKSYQLIMPNKYGELKNLPEKGFGIHWPVNPNFTGRTTICNILKKVDLLAGCELN